MTGRICGTGSYVPARIVENDELANLVDTNDAWIRERTGIARRHLAENETTSYMAAEAAKRALAQSDIPAEDVDLILVATSTPENVFPCTACEVQREIHAEHAAGFDLNAACSGFLFALQTAQAYIQAGIYRTVLVIGVDSMSHMVDWSDRSTCILFGDGAGAVVLRESKEGLFVQAAHSDGAKGDVLTGCSRHRKTGIIRMKQRQRTFRWTDKAYLNLQSGGCRKLWKSCLKKPGSKKKKFRISFYIRRTEGSLRLRQSGPEWIFRDFP